MRNQPTQHKAGGSVGASGGATRSEGSYVALLKEKTLAAAARRCNEFNDSPEASEQMKRAVLDTPVELLLDLHKALLPIVVEMGAADDETTTTEE